MRGIADTTYFISIRFLLSSILKSNMKQHSSLSYKAKWIWWMTILMDLPESFMVTQFFLFTFIMYIFWNQNLKTLYYRNLYLWKVWRCWIVDQKVTSSVSFSHHFSKTNHQLFEQQKKKTISSLIKIQLCHS